MCEHDMHITSAILNINSDDSTDSSAQNHSNPTAQQSRMWKEVYALDDVNDESNMPRMTKFPELSNDLTDDMVFPTIAVSRSLCTRLVHRE
eukprot:scaffold6020_cov81-Skeletonema_menzelii.AAC.3